MKRIKYCSHLLLGCCILLTACTHPNDFKITKEFADAVKQYSQLSSFKEGLAAVEAGGKWGFIDKTGKQVIPCLYNSWFRPYFSEGLAAVQIGEKRGFIDKNGKQIVPCLYDNAYYFSEELAVVKIGERWGFVDKYGTSTFDFDK